jgi:hypothetical protein
VRVALLQSNYLPWKGYFDIIGRVDLFVFHDDLQYTKGDWRNRNLIKTPKGPRWLTVPCGTSEKRLICEVELLNRDWQSTQWSQIRQNYSRAPFFDLYRGYLEEFFLGRVWRNLSVMNQHFISQVSRDVLGITTLLDDSRNHDLTLHKADRVLELLCKVGATTYVSGPAAKSYLSEERLAEAGIDVEWMNYDSYPKYPQLYPPFDHHVTVLDLLFSVGESAPGFMSSHEWTAARSLPP